MTLGKRSLTVSLCALIALGALFPGHARSNPRSFTFTRLISHLTTGASNFSHPTVILVGPIDPNDGQQHLFFAQQDGRIFDAKINSSFTVTLVTEIDTIYHYPAVCVPSSSNGAGRSSPA